MKILLIEDETFLAESIIEFLTASGFICEWAETFEMGFEKVSLYEYNCVLVDITLPGGSGLQIIEQLKKMKPDAGVIIISAKNSLDDKLTGLDLGADDYITKPFHLSELNARIKSVIRRRNFEGKKEILVNDIRVVPELSQVFVKNQELVLTKKEYEMLLFFLSNINRVLTKESIAEHLWGDDMDMADSFDFIYTHIKNIRKKIIEKGGKDCIHTVYGMGYKLAEEQ